MSPEISLPLIDISPFISPSSHSTRHTCAKSLSSACLHQGFFYLTNHGVPPLLTTQVLALAREFFISCTPDEKVRIKRQVVGRGIGDGARGYQVVGDNVTEGKRDWHEAIDWYRPITPGEGLFDVSNMHPEASSNYRQEEKSKSSVDSSELHNPARQPPYALLHGLNLWPSRPNDFRTVYETYIQAMLDLGTAVVRAMGWALELEDPETFVKATRESFWVMRAIGYPPLPNTTTLRHDSESGASDSGNEEDGGVSCGAHTDYGCLTLLLADDTTGALQVQSRLNPDEWINADPVPGAFVVNIGDMMERWTGGRWQSTRHRVVHRGEGMRVSVPFFFEPDFGARVGDLIGGEGEEGRGEVIYGEHLRGKVGGNFYGGGKED